MQNPLFVFGTLMDDEVLAAVSGMSLSDLQLNPAVATGFMRRLVLGESFPVLVPTADEKVSGLLIEGLSQEALDRCSFFEGDEYRLQDLQVERLPDSHSHLISGVVDAVYFADTDIYELDAKDWSIERWRIDDKPDFIPRLNHYMSFFGKLSTTEADKHW